MSFLSSYYRRSTALVWLLLLGLISSFTAFGQFDSATVLGTVVDPSGAVLAGATITLENVETGVRNTTTTDEQGNYQFPTVRIGGYRVSAESRGFKKAVASEFRVSVAARQRVDLTLTVGDVTESITVEGAARALETDTSSKGTVVSTQQIVNLPLNGRNYADLALLAPGVRKSGIATSRDASFNVNGMRSSLNNFVLDGVDNNSYGTSNQGFSNQVVQLSPDAVQEFRVETTNYSAEFGRAGGGVVNATIRSGTNQFHGSAWEYLRNTKLNATGFFKPVNNEKPVLIQNQYGGAIGGPIIKDKAFFFADYEGYRRISKRIQFVTLPTLAQRTGNLGIPVRNPFTGEEFQNGVIPSAQITRFAREVLADLPAPNRPGNSNNYESSPRRDDKTNKGDVRYDHYFGSSFTAFGRYSHRLMENFEPPNIPGASGGDANGNVRVLNQQIAVGTNHTLSPTALLEVRLGYSKTEGGKFPVVVSEQGVAERFGFANIPTDERFARGIYRQSINGYTALGVQNSNPQFQNPNVLNPKVNFSKIAGRHTLKAGYEFQAINTQIDDFHPKYGTDTYAGRFSQIPGTATNNLQFLADFLFGARSRYELTNPLIVDYRQRMHFLYLQDDFKVSPKLTLNLGVRYEFATPQWESENRLSNYDPVTNTIVQAKDGSIYDRALVKPDRNNWAPRVGLAYQLTGKTVIRSGYGISYIHFNRLGGENLLAFNLPQVLNVGIDQLGPLNGGRALCTGNTQGPFECFRATEQGYSNGLLSTQNVNATGVRTNYIPHDNPTGYSQSWHFTVQQELTQGLVLDVGYVGTRGVNLMILGDYNQARPNNPGENLSLNARRPIQGFGFIQAAFGAGFLNYHALQAKVEKRYSSGFSFLNSFTWSKAIDNASGHLEAQNGDNSRVNIRALQNEKGLSGYDQPFVNTTAITYELPFGRGRRIGNTWNPVVDGVLGGWRLTAVNMLASGLPVNLSYNAASQFQTSTAFSPRPNIIGDPKMPEGERTPQRYLNPLTVVNPTDPSQPFGNAGRNNLRGPGVAQLDLGLHKAFRIVEGQQIEFRAEAFNALNRTNFSNPDGNRSNAGFGTITSTQPAREIQLALKYIF